MEIKIKFDKEKMRQSARAKKAEIDKIIEDAISETQAEANSIFQEEYNNSNLRVRSGFLYGSFRTSKTVNSLRVWSNVVYSRIQDVGGYAGRNLASYIPPTFYFTNGAKKLQAYFMSRIRARFKK